MSAGLDRNRSAICLLFAVLLGITCPASFTAQPAATGAIVGKLTGVDGTPIANATVTTANAGTGEVCTTATDKNGRYEFMQLPVGSYAIRFSAAGYQMTEVLSIAVRPNETLSRDWSLSLSTDTRRGIAAETSEGQGAESAASNKADENKIKSLPLSTRNFTQAAGLSAGVSSQVANATNVGINTQSSHVGSGNTNNYLMDGVSVATSLSGAAAPGIPNPDAIQQNEVKSWTYDAGVGQYGGANIGVVTKSGSNAFHGTLFEFIRNDILNANDYFLKRKGYPEPVLKQNQFGGTFGGPINKDKLFFFGSYQGTRQSNGIAASGFSPNVTLPPMPTMRTAAELGALYCGSSGYFGGVTVACDGSNINPVALSLLNLKLANGSYYIPGSGNGSYEAVPYTIPAKFDEDQFLVNTDYKINDKNTVIERFFYSRDPQVSNFTGAIQQGPSSLPGAPSNIVTGDISGVVRLNTKINANLSNEMRISGQHYLLTDTPVLSLTNGDAGITSVVSSIDMIDIIDISGLFNLGGNGTFDHNSTNQYQWADQASWTIGRHNVRAGVELVHRQWNSTILGDARGVLTFMSVADFLLGLPGCPPSDAACSATNPLVNGATTNGSSFSNVYSSSGPAGFAATVTEPSGINHAYRYSDVNAFVQDDFKIAPRLTLNLGLRWGYFSLPLDTTGNITTFWPSLTTAGSIPPSSGTYEGFVVPSNFKGMLASGAYRNGRETPIPIGPPRDLFSPRAGFSWKPLGGADLTVRGGYGFFYDRPDPYYLDQQSLVAIPYATPVGGSGAANYSATLAQPFQTTSLGWGPARTVDFSAGTSSNLTLRMLEEHLSVPLTQKWNLEIEQQLPAKWILTVGYAGSHSIHQQIAEREINGAHVASSANPVNGLTTSTVKNAALRVPYLGIAPKGLDSEETSASGKYNSLLATVTKQLSHGVQLQGVFMFSKFLSTMSAGPGTIMNSNDPLDARQQYGPFAPAAPRRLALHYSWNLPYKSTGMKGRVLGDWGVSGMTVIQSGMPMTLTDTRGGTVYGNAGYSRAQFCSGKEARDVATSGSLEKRLNGYFNAAVFCKPPVLGDDGTATGYGNSSVGFIRGPGQDNTDLSIKKAVTLKKSQLELRMEMFNVFNHPQFSNPDTSVTDPTFGEITGSSVNPRLIQFAAKYSF